jgi:hypothetical protein
MTLLCALCVAVPLKAASTRGVAGTGYQNSDDMRRAKQARERDERAKRRAAHNNARLEKQRKAAAPAALSVALKAASNSTLGNLDQLHGDVMHRVMQLCGPAIHKFAGLNTESRQFVRDHVTAVTAQLRRHPFLAAASDADVTAYARAVIKTGKAPVATHDALRAAAGRGDMVGVQRLLTAPYLDVNHADAALGWTALIEAASNGHQPVVAQLLAVPGINVNHATNIGNTALMWAAWSGHAAVVGQLLAERGINVNHANNNGDTALIEAARYGHAAVVEQLLAARGINVHHADNGGNTALIWAAMWGHAAVVNLLRDAGAV